MQSGHKINTQIDSIWEFRQSSFNQYIYQCTNGNLGGSSVVIVKESEDNQLNCTISVQSDDSKIHSMIRPQMQQSCPLYIIGDTFSMFHFSFFKNDLISEKFISCIHMVNTISPMSDEILNKLLSHAQGNCLAMPSFFKQVPVIKITKPTTEKSAEKPNHIQIKSRK